MGWGVEGSRSSGEDGVEWTLPAVGGEDCDEVVVAAAAAAAAEATVVESSVRDQSGTRYSNTSIRPLPPLPTTAGIPTSPRSHRGCGVVLGAR